MANNSFLQDIAQINNERRARERVEQLQEIERQWQETGRECYEAWQRGDRETCELLGADLERLKGDYDYLNPPAPRRSISASSTSLARTTSFLNAMVSVPIRRSMPPTPT